MIEALIGQKKKQGQTIAIFCYDTPMNCETVGALSVKPDNIYMLEPSEAGEIEMSDCIKKIMRDKPDFLIIFAGEDSLLDKSAFIYDWGGKHVKVDKEEITYISRDVESTIVRIDKEIIFKSLDAEIEYPDEYSGKVRRYWDDLLESGKTYWDGLTYSVCQYHDSPDSLCFEFAKTNYRYMVYSKEHDFRNEFHTCTTASVAIIETSDGYSVLGKMNKASIFSEQYKCFGGTLDESDFDENKVCIERMFSREIAEELGIDVSDQNICLSNEEKWLLIRERMAFVGLCHIMRLTLNKDELIEAFRKKSRESEDEKEVESLLFIKSMDELNAIPKNEKADYVDELYRCYFGLKKGIGWEEYRKIWYEFVKRRIV